MAVIQIKKGSLDSNGDFVATGGLTFIFSGVDNFNDRHSSPNITINAPGQGSEETSNFNLGGLQRFISFDFQLINDGTDKADGTHTSAVTTIDEQYAYLKDTFLSGASDIQYQISWGTLVVVNCLIDDLPLNPTFNKPNFYKGSIQLSEGKNSLSIS